MRLAHPFWSLMTTYLCEFALTWGFVDLCLWPRSVSINHLWMNGGTEHTVYLQKMEIRDLDTHWIMRTKYFSWFVKLLLPDLAVCNLSIVCSDFQRAQVVLSDSVSFYLLEKVLGDKQIVLVSLNLFPGAQLPVDFLFEGKPLLDVKVGPSNTRGSKGEITPKGRCWNAFMEARWRSVWTLLMFSK